ncbi:hypothetical protein E4U42_007309 [Claviceps africana]|uniref:N-acetyltransferase domain-containing protein n=1 Tax=Claviceps africana TaxID=83212 RepID=A0A8K0J1I8_9HYPO|nr:hypothetical protein E4U42_007309 [Claviceps africana]
MSLPTTKPIQSSILSFFTSNPPKYAPPPGQSLLPVRQPPPKTAQPPHHEPPHQQPSPQQRRQDDQHPQQQEPHQPLVIPPLPPLPPAANIRIPTEADVPPLRRINSLLLQVSYPESFYASAVDNPLSRVITWCPPDGQQDPKVIGAIVCRVEEASPRPGGAHDDDAPPQNIYIRSLCLLAPYRGLGLARAALEHVLATASANKALGVAGVTAHVWSENEDGLRWYERQGFVRDGVRPIRGYYLKLRPDTAWLVRRPLSPDGSPGIVLVDGRLPSPSVTAAVVNLPASAPPASSRSKPAPGQSFQNQRPDGEWNDLPADMAPVPVAATSSRSNSAAPRKKRDRAYPAAAFGSN